MITHDPNPNGSRALDAHHLFRGAAEVTKIIRRAALLLELSAATIAAWGAFGGKTIWGGWASLVMLVFMVGSTVLRIWSRNTHHYSERCRRLSARAFSLGEEVGAAVLSGLASDAPLLASRLADRLPAKTLAEYYEPTTATGTSRLQEIYAHSAFYSWRLLRRTGWLFLGVTVVVSVVGGIVVFALALPSTATTMANRILDVVCSLVFAVLAAKALDAAAAAASAAREARIVADALLETTDTKRIHDLVMHYDMERTSGPGVPTVVYRLSRDGLQREWHKRRAALAEMA